MKRRIIISLSYVFLMVGLGVGLLIVPLIARAASGSVTHTTFADFTNSCTALPGVLSNPLYHSTEVSSVDNNVLLVTTNITDDFNSANLNTSLWATGNWTGTNVALVGSSILTVPTGTWVRSGETFTYGVLEFEAEFGAGEFQNVGFGSTNFNGNRFFVFSTYTGTTRLYARANNNANEQNLDLGPLPSGPHLYRIEWRPVNPSTDRADFYLDGVFQVGFNVPSNDTTMEARNFHLYVSNNSTVASDLQVDWIGLLSGYFPGGFYTSCVLDAGAGNDWSTTAWDATPPAQTNVALEARTSQNGTTWSSWQVVANGGDINPLGRYAQYRLNLASTDALTSPLVNSVTLNYETFPTLSINDVTVAEGNAGTVNAVFTVTLSSSFTKTVTVNYNTADGTALVPGDYLTSTGTLTFTPGITSQTVTVAVQGDTIDENDETFLVNLSNSLNANISDSQGQGTITDDDGPPSLSINDISVTEGSSGTTTAVFTVTLSPQSGKSVSVNYATANGTATSPADYTAKSGSLTFAPGVVSQNISITVQSDTIDENNETFLVNLSNSLNANINDSQGQGTITNDDGPPSLSINDISVTEGSSGTTTAVFTVTLSPQSGKSVSVNYATADGTATLADNDYLTATGSITFNPGIVTRAITVPVRGDGTLEPNETFFIDLRGATNANITDSQGTGTIINDDAVGVAVNQSGGTTNVVEGGATDTYQIKLTSQPTATVTISLNPNSQLSVTPPSALFTTANWSAAQTITVTAVNDTVAEGAHTGVISHTAASTDSNYNGLAISNVTVNITDNDGVEQKVFLPVLIK